LNELAAFPFISGGGFMIFEGGGGRF
jgi:hypothetical protein